jgi:hypothetical protein
MMRYGVLAVSVASSLAACGVEDDRPPTTEYIAAAIMAPSCGNAQCHSAFTNADGYTLDSVEAVQAELDDLTTLRLDGEPRSALVYDVLVRNVDRMPYDRPLADVDKALILEWVACTEQERSGTAQPLCNAGGAQ